MTSRQRGSTLLLLSLLASGAARADALDVAITRALRDSHVTGASVAVVRHGNIVELGAYGLAHVEDRAGVMPATRFETASISGYGDGWATAIRLVAALPSLGTARTDPAVFGPELTLRNPEELRQVLAHVKDVSFVSRRSLAGRPARWHDHLLVDVVTLRMQAPEEMLFLSCYRDAAGVVHDVEPTFR